MRIAQDQHYQGEDWWNWSVWVDAPPNELERVERVIWRLHPTFPEPVREHRNRADKFRLESAGWGTFHVRADTATWRHHAASISRRGARGARCPIRRAPPSTGQLICCGQAPPPSRAGPKGPAAPSDRRRPGRSCHRRRTRGRSRRQGSDHAEGGSRCGRDRDDAERAAARPDQAGGHPPSERPRHGSGGAIAPARRSPWNGCASLIPSACSARLEPDWMTLDVATARQQR